MPRVLIIAYDFLPCSIPGGSLRSTKFTELLPLFGWNPSVISKSTFEAEQQGELFESIHRVESLTPFSWPYEVSAYGWAISFYRYAKNLLNTQHHDLIYVSCPPFPQTLSCVRLKYRHNIPLVVDFRDAWSLDPYQEGSRLKKLVYRYLFPRIEKFILKHADQLILNTPSMLKAYQHLYPELAERMSVIPNGYEERDFNNFGRWQKTDTFELLYVGRFGVGGRDATALFRAIKNLDSDGFNIRLSLVGTQPDKLSTLRKQMSIEHLVKLESSLSHIDAISRMSACDVLVLYQETSVAEVQAVAGKTYEYLRSGKPILSIAPKGDNQDLISKYSKYSVQTMNCESSDITAAIVKLYKRWQQTGSENICPPDSNYRAQYERSELTRKLSEVFNTLTEKTEEKS